MDAPRLTVARAKNLRRRMTLPEVLLWTELRGRKFDGLRFRRQHPFGPYILDFYCDVPKLAVEIDGSGHEHPDAARHDAARDDWLARQGVQVLRLPASLVLSYMDGALQVIRQSARG